MNKVNLLVNLASQSYGFCIDQCNNTTCNEHTYSFVFKNSILITACMSLILEYFKIAKSSSLTATKFTFQKNNWNCFRDLKKMYNFFLEHFVSPKLADNSSIYVNFSL